MVSLIGQSQRTRENFFTSSKPAYLNSQGSLKLSHVPSNMLWAVSVNIIPRGTKFPILSDSQSVHLAISSSSKTIPIIRQIQKRTFNLLRQSINIPFHWVPRHKNIHGNELADKAARTAVNNPINTTHNIKIPAIAERILPFVTQKGSSWFWQHHNQKVPPGGPEVFSWAETLKNVLGQAKVGLSCTVR